MTSKVINELADILKSYYGYIVHVYLICICKSFTLKNALFWVFVSFDKIS